ncbi:extracellular solute-binding protein [Chelatococcus asaccharovorans]|uniref:Microcin C transport system substrate-binding protein n=1 Tax=Chelatococcus asaccharovorans TaxID=28210 RepID=A0A2V3TZ86_9HYPH|nr:microcin C transport system substrate-binding protein [Chelatococcus asaccharovorans]
MQFRLVAIACLAALVAPFSAAKAEMSWRHGLSLVGEPKYPQGFAHFDYVNPSAPQGGTLRLGSIGGFDNFNLALTGLKGELEIGISRIYDTLMTSSLDEISSEYGLVAESVSYPDDISSVTFRLRPQARFHDGTKMTPEDVIFSFETLKATSPMYMAYWRNVAKAEATGPNEVTFTFDEKGNRELPLIVGQLTVLPKHWWQGKTANGTPRDVTATTLEPPLGSGPYRMKTFEAGRYAVYEQVADYWAKDLPVNRGTNNFGEIRYDYFRDATVLFEAFKGDRIDWRRENVIRNWMTAYDFPAARDGRIVREEFPIRNLGIMQGMVFNLRREKFQDIRVRRAFNYAFDFEELNRTIFFDRYERINSFFFGTELASSGLPQGRELELLNAVKDKVPPEVFTTPYANPVGGTTEKKRDNLRTALGLLREAGYELKGTRLVDARTGTPFTMEILGYDQTMERWAAPFKAALERLGIGVSLRIVDAAQYQNRLRSFDFDATATLFPQSLSPGNEQRDFWGSHAADQPGSYNLAGIKNPAVDALIEQIIYAKTREELVAATHALDRVLLWSAYVVPQYYFMKELTARWDRFDHPKTMPYFGGAAFPTVWWSKAAAAANDNSRVGRNP